MDVDTVIETRTAASPVMQNLVDVSFARGVDPLIQFGVLVQPIYAHMRPTIPLLCAICAHEHSLPPDADIHTAVTLRNPLFVPSATALSLDDTPSTIPAGPTAFQFINGSPFLCHGTVTRRAGGTISTSIASTYLFGMPISPQMIDKINFQALNQHLMIFHPRDHRVYSFLNYLGEQGRGFVSYQDFCYVAIHRSKTAQLSLLQHQRTLPTQPADVTTAGGSFSQCHFCAQTDLVRRSLNPDDYILAELLHVILFFSGKY